MTDNNYMMYGTKRVYEKMMTFAQQSYVDWNTIESRYLEVIYNAMMHKEQQRTGFALTNDTQYLALTG